MSTPNTKKFLVLYLIPASVLAAWSQTDASTREAAEAKMRGEWQKWMADHGKILRITEAAGETKRVSAGGISDTKNDIVLYSIVEADSHEAAAKLFENHPHLQIPQSSIEVMEIRPMTGM
jgi:hypothetical protein